jgi:hypothetical protein
MGDRLIVLLGNDYLTEEEAAFYACSGTIRRPR